MEKKLIVLLILVFISSFCFAESISNYRVPDNVPINQGVTATGTYVPDANEEYSNKLCSFYFFDSEGNLVNRADDQYTDATGRFAMPPYELTEPIFVRDGNYSVTTVCGTASATDYFVVAQKQEVINFLGFKFFPQSVGWDLAYFTDSDILFNLMWMGVMIVFALFILYMAFK